MESQTDVYARALRSRWWIVAAVVVASLAAAQFFTARVTPVYRATASSTVTPAPALTETTELLRTLETLERRTVMATFAHLAGSRETRLDAAAVAGLGAADLELYRISASVVPNTNVIRMTVEGPDPTSSSALANAVAHATARKAGQLYRLFALQPLDPSIPAGRAVHPNGKRNLAVAGVLGLFLGVALAIGVEAINGFAARAPRRGRESQAVLGSA